jgi:hypothetical protein
MKKNNFTAVQMDELIIRASKKISGPATEPLNVLLIRALRTGQRYRQRRDDCCGRRNSWLNDRKNRR